MNRANEIAVIQDRKVFRIDAPAGTKIFQGDRSLKIDFDIVCVNGEMFLAKDVLAMASKGQNGFRLIGVESIDDE